MDDEINKAYVDDKPYSFGGKHRLYEEYAKEDVDKALKKMMYTQVLNSIDVRNCFHLYMCIEKGSFFNLMLYFLRNLNL